MNNSNEITVINENGKEKTYGQINDLWGLAMAIRDGHDFSQFDKSQLHYWSEQVLQTWHMAHDLKAAVEGQDQARIKQALPEVEIIEVKRSIDLVMIRDTDGKIKFRSKRDFTRQQMLDHSAMRSAEGAPQL